MLRDVTTKVTDGLLGFDTAKGEGVHVKIGPSTVASATPITMLGSMGAARIKERLGLSPLADAVMDSVENGSDRIFCIPVAASTAGTVSTVVKTGTAPGGGEVAVEGKPVNAFAVSIKMTGQGGLNLALFRFSIDGGHSFSDEVTVPVSGEYELAGIGLKLKFTVQGEGEGTAFQVGDTFTFTTTAPAMTNGDVLAAIEKLKTFPEIYEFVHIVGESALPLWQAVSAAQVELRDVYKKPVFFLLEAATLQANENLADYALRLEADRRKVGNYDLQVCAARGLYVKLDGTTQEVNLAGVVAGLYSRARVHESIGKTRDEAGFGISKLKLLELRPAGIEAVTQLLDEADFLTFREYDGLDNFYVYHTKMMSPENSDFRYAEDVRVKNKIIRETRREALQLLSDDIDLEDVQGELDTRAKFLYGPLQKMKDAHEISDAKIDVPPGQEETILKDETMRVKLRYLSRGYIREIEIDLGRAPSGT